jgi:23S rRNA (uracil1939-C5)-methyltransferase
MGRARVTPPAGAFLQATKAGEAALLATARSAISGATRIIDLFAGCGTFTFPMAETAPVHAVEGSADMVKTLQDAARYADGLKPITAETRDLFRRPVLSDEFAKYDAVVIDPPRAGAQAQVHELAKTEIPQIAFLSCNPISFARDAKTLIDAGYCLEWVQPIDQFRWSPHIELAARFTRPHMGR